MTIYKIAISDLAKIDLQNIVAYLTETESVTTAKHVERGILAEIKCLRKFPEAFAKDEYADTF